MHREALEQTRWIRMRPTHEWGTLEGKLPKLVSWSERVGAFMVGMLLALGAVLLCC